MAAAPSADPAAPPRSAVIVGGGFSGAVLALKLARAWPGAPVTLVERGARAGVGLAYGACAPHHLLNVPVSRMECGLSPTFGEWLQGCGADLADALAESGGALPDAFVPRALFGRYVEALLADALAARGEGLVRLRGEAVRVLEAPARGVVLDDGREVEAGLVVLATGNMAPGRPGAPAGAEVLEGAAFIPDPWAPDAFHGLDPDGAVLLVGAGLTMADVVLRLEADGHRGPLTAVSRHGWRPERHAAGGAWEPFLRRAEPRSAREALRLVRAELARARAAGVPWQRVFDAARPDAARVWRGWSPAERARFLRHLRARWDVHRHRMAPRIADRLDALMASGRLRVRAGRVRGLEPAPNGVTVELARRGGGCERIGPVARIVNCTGPRSDFHRLEAPLYGHLRRRDLLHPDALRLGLDTDHGAVVDAAGVASSWLHAVGPLTRPALWEVTAVPEINAQVDALVARLSAGGAAAPTLDLAFADLGAGI